jgi:DNA topoisomerase-1
MNNHYYNKINDKYYDSYNKKLLKNKKIIELFNSIYIPPVYKDHKYYIVSDNYNGNDNNIKDKDSIRVYTTSIDALGRSQYKYTKNHDIERNIDKYQTLLKTNKQIKKIFTKIDHDLEQKNISIKNIHIAIILKIMHKCNFRIGNKLYENKYGSIGMTTLKKEHIKFEKNKIYIDFIGKKKVPNSCVFQDKNIELILKKLYKSKNTYLFSYKDEKTNKIKDISVNDVNKYLEEFNITNKDLRTWNANYLFLYFLKNNIQDKELYLLTQKKVMKLSLDKTANFMHNTPSVCKKSYICKEIYNQLLENDMYYNLLKNNKVNIIKMMNI